MKSINPNELSKHTPEMQRVIVAYHNSTDKEVMDLVNNVINNRRANDVTIGYLSEKQLEIIRNCMKSQIQFSPRCVIDSDAIKHILKRHGSNGIADHSMQNNDDIARMPFVFANFDEVEFNGKFSQKYSCSDGSKAPLIALKKRIDGTYYVIEAVSDGKRKVSYVVSAYISK